MEEPEEVTRGYEELVAEDGNASGTSFLYDSALKGLEEQWVWIDALDTKAGILLGAGGVVAGLFFARRSILWFAPTWLGVAVAVVLLVSLALALLSFATRRYERAPDLEALVGSDERTEAALKAEELPHLLLALSINEPKIALKASLLFYSGLTLLVSVALFGAYFVYELL